VHILWTYVGKTDACIDLIQYNSDWYTLFYITDQTKRNILIWIMIVQVSWTDRFNHISSFFTLLKTSKHEIILLVKLSHLLKPFKILLELESECKVDTSKGINPKTYK
jgi:hypothetical protein